MRQRYCMSCDEWHSLDEPWPHAQQSSAIFSVMPDIAPFVTQDKVEITSRSGLRAYEQRTGTRQFGNDLASLHRELRHKVYGEN